MRLEVGFHQRFPPREKFRGHRQQQQPLFYIPHPYPHKLDTLKTMAAAATNSSTFPLFSSLALELRDQIWRDALPDKVGPALYFYRKGCWCPRYLSQSDEEYDPMDHELNLNFEFRHDLLDVVQFEVPLFFVNREARNIALAWVREHGIEMSAREDRQSPVFVCPFNPIRDVLYIALDKWDEFLREPDDRCFQPDILGQIITVKSADVTRIAVPEALLRGEVAAALADILVIPFSFFFFFFES